MHLMVQMRGMMVRSMHTGMKLLLLHHLRLYLYLLLVLHLLHGQHEELVTLDVPGPVFTAPAEAENVKEHHLTAEELESLMPMPEPARCMEWWVVLQIFARRKLMRMCVQDETII